MKTHPFRLVWLLGCLGSTALVARAVDSPRQEVLATYPYQPELVAVPAPAATVRSYDPVVEPSFRATEPPDRSFRELEVAMANARNKRAQSLFVWELRWNMELRAIGRPSFHEIDIPWSPMTTPTDIAFSPSSVGSVSNKLQARVPLANLSW